MGLFDDICLEFEKSQSVTHFVIDGDPMPRVKFGDEQNRMSLIRCPECDSGIGSFHMLSCTVEQCPLCDGKARDCSCSYEQRPRELLR
jgi:hypothetical protein